jgi:hypothetical protein
MDDFKDTILSNMVRTHPVVDASEPVNVLLTGIL